MRESSEMTFLEYKKFAEYCVRTKVKIGIITVPANEAYGIYRKMIDCGINVIWNFAPTYLAETEGVHIHNENMAVSLAIMSGYLNGTDVNEKRVLRRMNYSLRLL